MGYRREDRMPLCAYYILPFVQRICYVPNCEVYTFVNSFTFIIIFTIFTAQIGVGSYILYSTSTKPSC
jgi:hypothetical protein